MACEIDAQIPSVTAWRASSGHDHRANGTPHSFGGVQAIALTRVTCTGVNIGGRPDRFASPNDATPGTSPADYTVWRSHFGEPPGMGSGANANVDVPEPATFMLSTLGVAGWFCRRRRTTWLVPKLINA